MLRNPLMEAGALTALDTPIDLGKVDCDMYILAGQTDHICPWRACHRASRLFGGRTEFVMSGSGHVQSMVCPPANFKAKYFTNHHTGTDPDAWLKAGLDGCPQAMDLIARHCEMDVRLLVAVLERLKHYSSQPDRSTRPINSEPVLDLEPAYWLEILVRGEKR